jgi:hypothetical protein
MDQVKSLDALIRLELRTEKLSQGNDIAGSLDKAIEWTKNEMRKAAKKAALKPNVSKRRLMLDRQA